jgi:ankyrin repeat protein
MGDIEVVKKHLVDGAELETKDFRGWTPLHYAAYRGHKEIAELLIAKGANVNAKNNVGDTPLDLATHLSNPNASPEIADLIRKQGAKTGEVLKVEGTSFNQMPEIDLSSFTEEQQATILVRANKENCDCGCKMTVAECRNFPCWLVQE